MKRVLLCRTVEREFAVLTVDGGRFETPRTAANKAAFGSAGRLWTGPQIAGTVLYQSETALPFAAEVGPLTDSVLRHLDDVLPDLPGCTRMAELTEPGEEVRDAVQGTGLGSGSGAAAPSANPA